MINSTKLKAVMVEKGFSQRSLAETLKMSLTTLNSKLNNRTEFTVEEMQSLCDILQIEDISLRTKIFFT